MDPRIYQIALLAGLMAHGMLGLGFEIPPSQAMAIMAAVLARQWAGT
jgi:hypothetical protein